MLSRIRFFQMAFVWTILAVVLSQTMFATCTGSDRCNACKNCKYCEHCAKRGGTCGVCKKTDSA
jgi:hypothetical protein